MAVYNERMAFDGITTSALAKELQQSLSGGILSKIIQPEKDTLLLTWKVQKEQKHLFLSASASLPLVYLTDQKQQAPSQAPSFCMLLRKYIGGGRLLSVTQPSLDRVLFFAIEKRNELGDPKTWTLIAEIMGKHSNLILMDEEQVILDAMKHIPPSVSSVRTVLPGRTWFLPDTRHKKDPLSLDVASFSGLLATASEPIARWIPKQITGFSPLFAEELCFRADLDGGRPISSLSKEEVDRLARAFQMLMETIRKGQFAPELVYTEGRPREYAALPLSLYPDQKRQSFPSISNLIEQYYAEKELDRRIRQKSTDLRQIVHAAKERQARTLQSQETQLHRTENREQDKLYGELLYASGQSLPAGAKEIQVQNYYTGEPICIPLQSTLSLTENAEAYYRRYAKKKRTAADLTIRMQDTKDRLLHLESIETSLSLATDEQDLQEIRRELAENGYLRSTVKTKQKSLPAKPLQYRSSDGYLILVGKNNYQNEQVTFALGSADDWWFHAKNMPGAHVLVKTEGTTPPDRTFEEAASLAAYYSAGKLAPKVEIDYTLRRNIKKPAKAKPGFVIYATNYSMMAVPEISGIPSQPA